MQADDPRLAEARERAIKETQRVNDMMLTVMKNHLVLEFFMDGFLRSAGKRVKRKKFEQKLTICKQLKPPEIEPPIWELIDAANKLRNKIAHTMDQEQIAKKIAVVREKHAAALTPYQAEGVNALDNLRNVSGAFELCGAYIVAATKS